MSSVRGLLLFRYARLTRLPGFLPESRQTRPVSEGCSSESPKSGSPSDSSPTAPWLPAVLVFFIAAGVWVGGLPGPYQFDDRVTPLGDPASQSLTAWSANLSKTLRPLTKLTYAAESSLGWRENPAPRRAVNILFHAVTAPLLLWLILGLAPNLPKWLAFAVALIWAVHPAHAENVLQVSGRTVGLSNLLLIGAMLAAVWRRPIAAATLLILAGLARETALAGILALIAIETAVHDLPFQQRLKRLAPLAVATLFLGFWYASTERYWALAEFSLFGRPLIPSAAAQVGAVPIGLMLFLRPEALSVDYGIPLPDSFFSLGFAMGAGIYLFVLAGALLSARRCPPLAVGLAVWLAALIPTQSVIPKLDALTSRPLSLALAGLLLASAPLMAKATRSRKLVAASVLLVLLGLSAWLAFWTQHRAQLYSSELLLWEDAASKSVVKSRPHLYYALLLMSEGRNEEAKREISAAQKIDPFDSRIATLFKQMEPTEKLE